MLQHPRGVAERLASLKVVLLGHPDVLQRDLAVLDHLERDLVLDLLDAEAGRGLVLDDEALDLVVGDVARPDDRDVAPGRVADPPLLAVEDPGVALALRRRRQAAGRPGTHQRLGQAEAADLLEAGHRRQPLLLLLLRSRGVDGAHGQAVVDAEEGRDRRVDARHLHRDQAEQQRTSASAPVSLHSQAAEIQLLERRQQFERECVLDPVLVDDRRDLGLHERTHLLQERAVPRRSRCRRAGRSRCSAPAAASVPCPFRSRASVFTGASTVMVISSFVVVSSVSTGDQSVKVFLSCALLGSVADVRPSNHFRTRRRGARGPWRAPPGSPSALPTTSM